MCLWFDLSLGQSFKSTFLLLFLISRVERRFSFWKSLLEQLFMVSESWSFFLHFLTWRIINPATHRSTRTATKPTPKMMAAKPRLSFSPTLGLGVVGEGTLLDWHWGPLKCAGQMHKGWPFGPLVQVPPFRQGCEAQRSAGLSQWRPVYPGGQMQV